MFNTSSSTPPLTNPMPLAIFYSLSSSLDLELQNLFAIIKFTPPSLTKSASSSNYQKAKYSSASSPHIEKD